MQLSKKSLATLLAPLLLVIGSASIKAQAENEKPPLEVVESVDLDRYLGRWYEVASIPQSFQRGCRNSQAEYSKMSRNRIRVINTCLANGRTKRVKGKAWIADTATNAKLKVQFFWPFKGDYWIIELDEGYQYAVVGNPERTSLWILSRSPKISDELYDRLLHRIEFTHFYDPSLVVRPAALDAVE